MRTKRVEYNKGCYIVDKNLEQVVCDKVRCLVDEIVDDIGKEYFIPDLYAIVMNFVSENFRDKIVRDICLNTMEEVNQKNENNS